MMVTDASISNQPPGACDVSPGNLAHECAIRASRPPFLARKQSFVSIFAPKKVIWACISRGRLHWWLGGPVPELGKGQMGNMSFSFVYYSDDEGQSWHRSRNEVHASVNGGMVGGFSMSEPQVAELDDGRLILMALTPLGRLFRCYSTDRGESWLEAEPTDLAVCGGGCFPLKASPTQVIC